MKNGGKNKSVAFIILFSIYNVCLHLGKKKLRKLNLRFDHTSV